MFLWSAQEFEQADLVLPDGAKIHYVRVSEGTGPEDAVFEHVETAETSATPTAFYRSVLAWNGAGWDLRLKDGTVYVFGDSAPLQAIRDRHGNTITIARLVGGIGPVARVTSPHGRWFEFSYEGPLISQINDNIGRTWRYTYDSNSRLWKVTDPMEYVTEYTYDANHNMISVKNRNGVVYVTNDYTTEADAPTPVGWVKKQTHADGGVYEFTYTVVGGKSTQTDVKDPRGFVRRTTFNGEGYTLVDTRALGQPTEQAAEAVRQAGAQFVTSSTHSSGDQATVTYDASGNLTSVTRLGGAPTTYTHHPTLQRITSVTGPLNRTTAYGYDEAGNVTSITDPLQHQTTFTFNDTGQRLSVTDALEHTTSYTYTGADLSTTTEPGGAVTTQFTDSVGRVVAVTNPLGQTTRYTYDANDRKTSVTNALGHQTTFEYFPEGQLKKVTNPDQHATTYTYDSMGRLTSRTDPLMRTETLAYDHQGNLIESVDRNGQLTTRTYDALGRLETITYADSSSLTYTYDDRSRATHVVDSAGATIVRAYDDLDRVTSETTPQGTVTYTYDAAGRRETMTVPDQPVIIYTYDDADRLTTISQGTSTVTFEYDDANRRTSLTLPNGLNTGYEYDERDQFSALTYRQGSTELGTLTYTYDLNGRRTSAGGTWARTGLPAAVASATYDAANQLTSWGGQLREYDPNGSLVSDGLSSYVWDTRGRLAEISGSTVASFAYDALGRRVAATSSGATNQYMYDGLMVVSESRTTGTVSFLNGIEPDEWLVRSDTTGPASFLRDGLGSTLAVADSAGALVGHSTYEPFGGTRTFGLADTQGRFTGREQDPDGLYYYRARYYDTEVGRFLSEDPAGADQFGNAYAYVENDPTNAIDPTGTTKVEACCRGLLRKVVGKIWRHCYIKIIYDSGTEQTYGVLGDPDSSKNQIPRTRDRGGKNGTDRNSGGECKDVPGNECQIQKLK